MEANGVEDGIHFQSYPFDFLEFLNHQRFEPMDAYNHQEQAKAVASLPCTQTQYDYSHQPLVSHLQFDRASISKPKELKSEGQSSSIANSIDLTASIPKKNDSTTTPEYTVQSPVSAAQTLFDATTAFNSSQWGIVDLSSHQHLFTNLKRAAPAQPIQPEDQGKADKNYFRQLKYLIDRRFPCSVCHKSFKESSHLVQHMLVHTGERPYECTTCGRTYNHISSLIRHRRCHRNEVVTTESTTPTAQEGALTVAPMSGSVEVILSQQEGPFTCSQCWKVFKKQSHLHQHQIIHTGEKPFSCAVCEKSFNRRESLKRHEKTHSDLLRVQCEVCGKEFRDVSYLTKHQATHTGERPDYKCDLCGKSYIALQSLLKHKQTHKNQRAHILPQPTSLTLPKAQEANVEKVKEPSIQVCYDNLLIQVPGSSETENSGPAAAVPHSSTTPPQECTPVSTSSHKNYCCGICGRGFGRRETLKRHDRIHTGEKPHQCAICGKRFRESFHLTKHHVVHTRERPYKCDLCGKVFGYPQSLTRHKQIHRLQLPCSLPSGSLPPEGLTFGCLECGERFPDSFLLMNHKELHMGEKPYACDVCAKCFGFIENLLWHKLIHQTEPERLISPVGSCHNSSEQQQTSSMPNALPSSTVPMVVATTAAPMGATPVEEHPMIPSGERFFCSICGQSFKHFLGLVIHKYVHLVKRTPACNVCGQSFARAYDLLLHRRTHVQKRHFICSVCGKRFWEAALLMRHQRCHTEERPYRCKVCGRGFQYSWYLRQHKVVHTGERAYKCALCNKHFAQSSSLAEHQRLHVVARPQRCQICNKTFRYRSNLMEHQRVHLGEKMYRCDLCGKSFFYLSSILRHQRSHDTKRDLRCSFCFKLFKDPKYFSKHMQTHQGGRPFKCGACGEGFGNTYGLKKHRLVHKTARLAAAIAVGNKDSDVAASVPHMRVVSSRH